MSGDAFLNKKIRAISKRQNNVLFRSIHYHYEYYFFFFIRTVRLSQVQSVAKDQDLGQFRLPTN